jgi:hypothetical protein
MVKVVLFPGGRQTPMRVNLRLTPRGALSRHRCPTSVPTAPQCSSFIRSGSATPVVHSGGNALRWMSVGGAKNVKPEKIRNDIVDATYVAYAT